MYIYSFKQEGKPVKEYELVASTRQIIKGTVNYGNPDLKPMTWQYKSRTELGQRLLAHECEWCGTQQGQIEVHHIRKLKDVKGKAVWERQMIERRRKTMVLCVTCHDELHAGKLSEKTRKLRGNGRAGYAERCKVGSEGSTVKPSVATC